MMKPLTKLLFLVSILAFATGTPRFAHAINAQKPYTIMIYMNGTDLEGRGAYATQNILQMIQAGGTNAALNVIVQTGGTRLWHNDIVNPNRTQRWEISTGNNPATAVRRVGEFPGNLDMGDPQNLASFLQWGASNYPAQHYVLVMWDHGGGPIYGWGHDEWTGHSLSVEQIQQAIRASAVRLDILGYDACLMSTVEIASSTHGLVDYVVGSEELEPGNGWDYATVINTIKQNPAIPPEALGKAMADGFVNFNQALDGVTQSVIRVDAVPALNLAIEEMASMLNTSLYFNVTSVSRALSKAESYGINANPDNSTDTVDLLDLTKELVQQGLLPQHTLDRLTAAVNASVVYSRSNATRPKASGIATYFPYRARGSYLDRSNYYTRQRLSGPNYTTLIKDYAHLILADIVGPAFAATRFTRDAQIAPTAPRTATATLTPESHAELDQAYAVLLRTHPRTGRLRMLANRLATVSSDHVLTADITSWPTLNNHPFNWDRINEDDDFEYLHFVLRAHTGSRVFPVMLSAIRDKSTGQYRINLADAQILDNTYKLIDRASLKLKPGMRIETVYKEYASASAADVNAGPRFVPSGIVFKIPKTGLNIINRPLRPGPTSAGSFLAEGLDRNLALSPLFPLKR